MLSAPELISVIIALFGFVGTVVMLVINLSIRASINALKTSFLVDIARVELALANLRTDVAKEATNGARELASLYKQITENVGINYMNRKESEAMHSANLRRLDNIEAELRDIQNKK